MFRRKNIFQEREPELNSCNNTSPGHWSSGTNHNLSLLINKINGQGEDSFRTFEDYIIDFTIDPSLFSVYMIGQNEVINPLYRLRHEFPEIPTHKLYHMGGRYAKTF